MLFWRVWEFYSLYGGGFYIVLNFLFVIGKKFEEFGIEDLFIEFGVYGSNIILVLFNGKFYNCGVCVYKLIMEVLLRL